MYWAVSQPDIWGPDEWEGSGDRNLGAWPDVGRHLHWTPDILSKGRWLARKMLGIEEGMLPRDTPEEEKDFPPYISLHIRRGPSPTPGGLLETYLNWPIARSP